MSYFDKLLDKMPEFDRWFKALKEKAQVDFGWYPYETIGGLRHLAPIVPSKIEHLFNGKHDIADIGSADGAVSFFLESMGSRCDIYDYEPTNFNQLQGARYIKQQTGSKVGIYSVDLDSQFTLEKHYDLIFLLGIFYHLKNPFYVLEFLARRTQYLCFSTRIARLPHVGGADISALPVAYLLAPDECNNDATNYWIFTETGLKRIFDRAGWNIMSFRTVGDIEHSNPQVDKNREGAWAVLESKWIK